MNPVFRRAPLAACSPHTVVSTYETDGETMALAPSLVMSEGAVYISVSQPPGLGINYTGPREVLLEFVILVF